MGWMVVEEQMAAGSALAVRAQRGDRAARDALWARETPFLRAKAREVWAQLADEFGPRASPGPVAVEDAQQEAFLVFLALLERWRPECGIAFGPYLNRR